MMCRNSRYKNVTRLSGGSFTSSNCFVLSFHLPKIDLDKLPLCVNKCMVCLIGYSPTFCPGEGVREGGRDTSHAYVKKHHICGKKNAK